MKNNIRSSQLITPFGIGQLVNFPGEQSYIIGGLDLWDSLLQIREATGGQIDKNEFLIHESRLENLLRVQYFYRPFPYKTTGNTNKYLEIPGIRFPQWHYCTNPRCGAMREIPLLQTDTPICTDCGYKMIPVRFVAACPQGHIQDVPFKEWIHNGPVPDDGQNHNLSYHASSGTGDLGSIWIKCTCGAQKSLSGLMNVSKTPDSMVYNSALASIGLNAVERQNINVQNPNNNNPSGQYCRGSRPWLGPEHMNDSCGQHLQVLIRGGSNIHYSNIVSALYLPDFDATTNNYVGKIIDEVGIETLKNYYNQTTDHQILMAILATRPEIINGFITADDAFEEIEHIILSSTDDENNNEIISELDLRYQEYQYILNERNSENADFKSVVKTFDEYGEGDFLNNFFEKVVLIEKLKETRVFRGFARINSNNTINMSELSSSNVNWLPAIQVFGEGIFLQFKKEKLDAWLSQFNDSDYPLISRYVQVWGQHPRFDTINPVFVMMHTFAHLLIKRLTFNSGYGSSALRERIYFSSEDNKEMHGILIYTSSGDSEGSLGGLVRQGKENHLAKLIKEAVSDAEWCSADPVCSDIGQSSGQGPDSLNSSSCHNCCLVPETSCEEYNILLDRALITGTFNNSNLGFFNEN